MTSGRPRIGRRRCLHRPRPNSTHDRSPRYHVAELLARYSDDRYRGYYYSLPDHTLEGSTVTIDARHSHGGGRAGAEPVVGSPQQRGASAREMQQLLVQRSEVCSFWCVSRVAIRAPANCGYAPSPQPQPETHPHHSPPPPQPRVFGAKLQREQRIAAGPNGPHNRDDEPLGSAEEALIQEGRALAAYVLAVTTQTLPDSHTCAPRAQVLPLPAPPLPSPPLPPL